MGALSRRRYLRTEGREGLVSMMSDSRTRSVAALGDVTDVGCWSGIPFHFWTAALTAGFAEIPWRLDLEPMRSLRWRWTLGRILRGHPPRGFQYSNAFLDAASAQVPETYLSTEVISFNQHFPIAARVLAAGGHMNHFIDATFYSMTSNRGLDLRLPDDVVAEGREKERANYAASNRIIAMARWTAKSLSEDCAVDRVKASTILPGANIDLPTELIFENAQPPERPGREREFVLGFIGMDWKRKGLPLLLAVRDELARRGQKVMVLAAGDVPGSLRRREGLRFVGWLEKRSGHQPFVQFLRACDIGCLFSENEALGISTLEFLRAGVPVAGFAHQGLADTLPPDAGFRFPLRATCNDVADVFEAYLQNESKQDAFRRNARAWSSFVTWERCITEMQELWQTDSVQNPVRPWLGLKNQGKSFRPNWSLDP
jgi:glycosyltransferase involved in cell wall biosynthesis